MKLGSFVGKGTISLNDTEVANIIRTIDENINNKFGFVDYSIEHYEVQSYDNERTISVKVVFTDGKTRRDSEGNSYLPKYIRISVRKQKGYDSKVYGQFYDWEEGFVPPYDQHSYSATIDLMGLYRRYRAKNIEEGVGITRTSYEYGTELSDLDFEGAIRKIASYMSHSTFNKTELKPYVPHCLNSN